MIKTDLYTYEGNGKGTVGLPGQYDVKPNLELLSHAVHVYEDNGHLGLARAKTRSEVAISTRKIYRQKGTGGARHGAKSAPIFVGGGVAHGPKGIKRVLHLSKLQQKKALLYALNYKIIESKLVLVEGLDKIKKTKEAFNLIEKISKDKNWNKKRNVVVALSEGNKDSLRCFRNIEGVAVDFFRNLNVYKVYLANGMIVDRMAFEDTAKVSVVKDGDKKIPVIKKSGVKEKKVSAKSKGTVKLKETKSTGRKKNNKVQDKRIKKGDKQ